MTTNYQSQSRRLAVALAGFAVLGTAPLLASSLTRELRPWMPCLAWLCLLQVAFAGFLYQVTDWASTRSAATFTAGMAILFSATTAVGLFATSTNELLIALGLSSARNWLAAWSLCQLCIFVGLTYLLGRCAARWRQAV